MFTSVGLLQEAVGEREAKGTSERSEEGGGGPQDAKNDAGSNVTV